VNTNPEPEGNPSEVNPILITSAGPVGALTERRPVPVLYLDLDGTVRKGKAELGRFVNTVADVEVFPEAIARMTLWKARGGRVVAVSNQGGIALGIVTRGQVEAAMAETQRQTGHLFDLLQACPHHPLADNPAMARCWCRKPSGGAVAQAAAALAAMCPGEVYPASLGLFVGDMDDDMGCARNAGLDFLDAKVWREGP
jgi:D-glycero-D-manno-heptose 1,7-bisphosphate phosphatase